MRPRVASSRIGTRSFRAVALHFDDDGTSFKQLGIHGMTASRRMFAALAAMVALIVLVAILGAREKQSDDEIALPAPSTPEIQPNTTSPTPIGELAEAEIRSALTDACSDAAPESDIDLTREDLKAQYDAFVELQLSLSKRLLASAAAEHLHLAALLGDDPALRIELLDRAISRNPSDPFLIWGAVQICSEIDAATPCPLRDWEQRLIAVDGQNSESWIRIAANRYAAGEYDKALEAMRFASTAAESRAYWTETIEMIERGLAAGSDFAFPERSRIAVGVAAAKIPRYGDYVTMCKEQSAKNVDWAYACVAYGELVEIQGKTTMGVAIARTIQKLALEALGELEKAAAVEQQLQARRQEWTDWFDNDNFVSERLIFSNQTLFYSYLAALRSKGELEARLYLTEEVERLIEQQPELACKPD